MRPGLISRATHLFQSSMGRGSLAWESIYQNTVWSWIKYIRSTCYCFFPNSTTYPPYRMKFDQISGHFTPLPLKSRLAQRIVEFKMDLYRLIYSPTRDTSGGSFGPIWSESAGVAGGPISQKLQVPVTHHFPYWDSKGYWKTFSKTDKDMGMLRSLYHGCWWSCHC